MKEFVVFISGIAAGAALVMMWAAGLRGWPVERKRRARHTHDNSWIS